MDQVPQARRTTHLAAPLLTTLLVAAIGAGAFILWRQDRRLAELTATVAASDTALQEILGEVTRIRVEQRADAVGTRGLLAKLKTYAPLVSSARIPEPDYQAAKKEMDAIVRAFAAIGQDAWGPITDRLRELKGDKDFDEARWLVRAALAVDPKSAKEIVKEILAGKRLPAPRLRLDAARMMIESDRQVAQQMLRQILLTESSHGVNVERAMAMGTQIPDANALSATGFQNFVLLYLQTDDAQTDDTLLMVVGRAEHDVPTVQECVKALGQRHCARAAETIEKLFKSPPNNVMNPLFLNYCLTALHDIRGEAARPFIEDALKTATSDIVANHCKTLLGKT